MSRSLSFILLAAAFTITPALALAEVSVVVARFTGPGANKREIGELQKLLRKVDGLKVKSTRQFNKHAKRRKVQWKIPGNKKALKRVTRGLKIDAVVYLKSRKKRRDRILKVTIYSGADGSVMGKHDVRVKRGHFKKAIWEEVRELIKADLGIEGGGAMVADVQPDPVVPDPVVPDPVVEPDHRGGNDRYDDRRDDNRREERRDDYSRDDNRRDDYRRDDYRRDDYRRDDHRRDDYNRGDSRRDDNRRDDNRRDDYRQDDRRDDYRRDGRRDDHRRDDPPKEGARPHPLFALHGGAAFQARHFSYQLEYGRPGKEEPEEAEIDYNSSLVPGFVIDGEVYPLARVLSGFGRGLGLGFSFEKVFLQTKQEVEYTAGETRVEALETTHAHFKGRLFYKHTFGEGLAPQLWGGLTYGLLDFVVEDNPEYNGASYSYFGENIGGYIPFGTPAAGLDLDLGIVQADLGDSVEELGGSVNTFGYRLYFGYAGRFLEQLSVKLGMEYTLLKQTVAGRGRQYGPDTEDLPPEHGRTGTEAQDQYINFRLMAGYVF